MPKENSHSSEQATVFASTPRWALAFVALIALALFVAWLSGPANQALIIESMGGKTTEELAEHLHDARPHVRHRATEALLHRSLPDAEIYAIASETLGNEQSGVFCTGINLLNGFARASTENISQLLRGASSNDAFTRSCSARGLGLVGLEDERSFPALMTMLEDDEGIVRESAMEAIVGYGTDAKPAIPQFIANMRFSMADYDEDGNYLGSAYYGTKAIRLIAKIDPYSSAAIEALLRQVENPSHSVNGARYAGRALAEMLATNPRIFDIVKQKFASNGRFCIALLEIGTDAAVQLIVQGIGLPGNSAQPDTITCVSANVGYFSKRQKRWLIAKLEADLRNAMETATTENRHRNSVLRIFIQVKPQSEVLKAYLEWLANMPGHEDWATKAITSVNQASREQWPHDW